MPDRIGSRDRHLPFDLGAGMKGLLLSGGMDSIALAWWLRPEQAISTRSASPVFPSTARRLGETEETSSPRLVSPPNTWRAVQSTSALPGQPTRLAKGIRKRAIRPMASRFHRQC